MKTKLIGLLLFAVLPCCMTAFHASAGKPVKVFILSGQSNMEGKGAVTTLDAILNNPEHEHRDTIKHLKKDGQWVQRDDVFVTFLDRDPTAVSPAHGPLSIGFGSVMKLKDDQGKWQRVSGIGPELGIGWVLGEHFDEPVLLIKAAWGGRSVNHTFRPPSAMPSEAEFKAILSDAKKNPEATLEEVREKYGRDYRKVISEVARVLDDIDQYVPGYKSEDGYEIAGFIWFQGWNDMVSGGNPDYTEQLAHFIRDMRRDLNTPGMPFVIGEMGCKGVDAGGGYERFRQWQRAVVAKDEFQGNVSLAETARYWPTELDTSDVYRAIGKRVRENDAKPLDDPTRFDSKEYWRVNFTDKYGHLMPYRSDRPFHYMGSGLCYYQMGESMGQAMIGLLADPTLAQEQGKHLFILSGQSNMAGMDPNLTFTPAVEEAFGKDQVIVVKYAMGAQPIRHWYKDWKPAEGDPPEGLKPYLYSRLMRKVNEAIKDQTIASVTFIWMQGERDAKEKHGEVYAASLRGLIDQVATDLKREQINFVIGRLSDYDMSNQRCPHWTMVRDAQVRVAEDNSRGAWVDTDDLNEGKNKKGKEIKNDLHYSVEGYKTLGKRFAEKAITLIK